MVALVHRRERTRGRRREPRDAARIPHRDGLGGRHEGRVGRSRRPGGGGRRRDRGHDTARAGGRRAAAGQDRARRSGHRRDRGHATGARHGHGARDRVRRRHDRALLRHGRAARARGPPRREPGRDLRRRRPLLPGLGTRVAVRVRPAAGLPAPQRRHVLPDPVGALIGRLRRPPRERGDRLPRLQRRANVVGRGHDRAGRHGRAAVGAREPAPARLRRRLARRDPAPLHAPRRPPARAGRAVGVGRVVPAGRRSSPTRSASSRSCRRPTRPCR